MTNTGPDTRFLETGMKSCKAVADVPKHPAELGPADGPRLQEGQERAVFGVGQDE